MSRRAVAFWTLLALYVVLTILVLVPSSPVLSLDRTLVDLHLKAQYPALRPWINGYVHFGQRAPATLTFLPVFLWVTWRQRSKRPLVLLGVALALLNASVGVVKYLTGRIGPMHVPDTAVHRIFAGGDIYPSGHVSNAVVLYGLIAWILPARVRKVAIGVAVFLSITVGLSTIYLRTHWFSDVLGGWLAGGLVLLALPTVVPYVERCVDWVFDRIKARFVRGRHRSVSPVEPSGDQRPVPAEIKSGDVENLDEPSRVA